MHKDIKEIREQIDHIDAQIASLFERRMELMEDVRAYKKINHLPILDEQREQAVLERCSDRLNNQEYASYYVQLQKMMMQLGRERQRQLEELDASDSQVQS